MIVEVGRGKDGWGVYVSVNAGSFVWRRVVSCDGVDVFVDRLVNDVVTR
jgi:hypothetical protein